MLTWPFIVISVIYFILFLFLFLFLLVDKFLAEDSKKTCGKTRNLLIETWELQLSGKKNFKSSKSIPITDDINEL